MIDVNYERDYIKRQLNIIKQVSYDYKNRQKSFINLVADLDGLISAISQYEENLSDDLRTEWWDLEQVNALTLDEEYKKNNISEYEKDILNTLSKVLTLVEHKLRKLNPEND